MNFTSKEYLPNSEKRIEQLRKIINGRPVAILAAGPSIYDLERRIGELRHADICYVGMNRFFVQEKYILQKINKHFSICLNIVFLQNFVNDFLDRDEENMFIAWLFTQDVELFRSFPSRHYKFLSKYDKKLLSISIAEKGIRFRPVDNIIEELKKYIRDYEVNYVVFWDELFMFSERRVAEITEAILNENIKINYWCTGRLNIVNPRILKMLKESGCKYIDYGIEQYAGINIAFNIIFGNIGDTRESLRKSVDLLKKYNDYGQLRVIRPITPLYNIAIERGLLTGPEDFYIKHKNVELLTVNFTDIPDSEFNELMFVTNKEIIMDYYNNIANEMIENFYDVYFNNDIGFRGARHA